MVGEHMQVRRGWALVAAEEAEGAWDLDPAEEVVEWEGAPGRRTTTGLLVCGRLLGEMDLESSEKRTDDCGRLTRVGEADREKKPPPTEGECCGAVAKE